MRRQGVPDRVRRRLIYVAFAHRQHFTTLGKIACMRAYERHPRSDARQMRQIAIAEGLTSYVNNRSWRVVFATFQNWPNRPPRFRVLDRLASPDPSEWSRQWMKYPRPFVSLQWIEVELPPSDALRAIKEFRARKYLIEPVEVGVRIWGWIGGKHRPLNVQDSD